MVSQSWFLLVENVLLNQDAVNGTDNIRIPINYVYHNSVEDWKTNIITPIKEKYPKR